MERALALPAPAKLNLFLHVLGRRADGYHELQSAFALIDLCDLIDIESRADGELRRSGDLVSGEAEDLPLRAARLLRQHADGHLGADIRVTKRIPVGAGLGGGSSDAATTLLALNRIWATRLDRDQLEKRLEAHLCVRVASLERIICHDRAAGDGSWLVPNRARP